MLDLSLDDLKNHNSGRGLKKIYDHYAPFVWRLTLRSIGNEHDAKIVVQNVFVVLNKSIKNFRFESAFSTWLYRIALNEIVKFINKKKSRRELPLNDNIEIRSGEDKISDKNLVEKILSTLSAQERFLLVSREVDGFSFDELAEMTGKTAGALRVELMRLKQKIRGNFDENI